MIRVLQIFNTMGNGGIDHFIMDRYRMIDRTKVQFDFLLTYNQKGYFDDEIRLLGGKIYYVGPMNKRPIKTFLQIKKIVKENQYKIVHRHSGNAIAYFDLRAAKLGGATNLILHSHNNNAGLPLIHNMAKKLLSFDCIRFACSKSAGKWMFDDKPFTVINNGIEVSKFEFDESLRNEVRKKYNIKEDEFVVGHTGRFDYQKNHKFLIDVFREVKIINPKAKLMCVGDGFLRSDIEKKVKEYNLENAVVFTGSIDNVNEVINAFDVFCLPSVYEGLPITLIETQTNGLHCVVSKERVTEECNITNNVSFISLNESPKCWAKEIVTSSKERNIFVTEKIKRARYSIEQSVKELQNYYLRSL